MKDKVILLLSAVLSCSVRAQTSMCTSSSAGPVMILSGKSVDTKCSITGNIGGLMWNHNSTYLDTSNAAKYMYTPGSATLTIMNADFSDSGTYGCVANSVDCPANSIAVIPACMCLNGGTCSGSVCACPPGYTGTLCGTLCPTNCPASYNNCNCVTSTPTTTLISASSSNSYGSASSSPLSSLPPNNTSTAPLDDTHVVAIVIPIVVLLLCIVIVVAASIVVIVVFRAQKTCTSLDVSTVRRVVSDGGEDPNTISSISSNSIFKEQTILYNNTVLETNCSENNDNTASSPQNCDEIFNPDNKSQRRSVAENSETIDNFNIPMENISDDREV